VRRLPDDLSCILTPEQIEGPYFLDTGLLRRDIAEDRVGIPLRLDLRLAAVAGESCEPLRGALVEVWHADAEGAYSGTPENRETSAMPPERPFCADTR
jgi:protocatechuate 3,4-dioxygenase beta subunit